MTLALGFTLLALGVLGVAVFVTISIRNHLREQRAKKETP